MSRKRIVVITHSYYPAIGGVETFIDHYLSKLAPEQYHISIYTADKNIKQAALQYVHKGLQVQVIKSRTVAGMVFPVSLPALFRLVSDLRHAHFVHQHDIKFLSTFLWLLSFIFPFRLLLFSHGYMYHSNRFPLIKNLFLKYFSFLSRRYQSIVNISKNDYAVAKKFHFRNSVFIQEAVDLTGFQSVVKKPRQGRYLYFGRIARNKGLDQLFACLHTIRHQPFELLVVGNGDVNYISELRQKQKFLELEDRIKWVSGATNSQLLEYVAEAEIIFLPSLYEGFGISLLESIASGSRIMAHVNDAYKAILEKLEWTHCLFDYGCTDAFAGKLNQLLLQEPGVCTRLYLFDHGYMVKQIEKAQDGGLIIQQD